MFLTLQHDSHTACSVGRVNFALGRLIDLSPLQTHFLADEIAMEQAEGEDEVISYVGKLPLRAVQRPRVQAYVQAGPDVPGDNS